MYWMYYFFVYWMYYFILYGLTTGCTIVLDVLLLYVLYVIRLNVLDVLLLIAQTNYWMHLSTGCTATYCADSLLDVLTCLKYYYCTGCTTSYYTECTAVKYRICVITLIFFGRFKKKEWRIRYPFGLR